MSLYQWFLAVAALFVSGAAYLMGRSFILYFLLSCFNPLVGLVVLIFRHARDPREIAPGFKSLVSRVKLRLWSRKLDPDDFNDSPS